MPSGLTTPTLAACRVMSPVSTVNNAVTQTLLADVIVPRAGPTADASITAGSTGMMVLAATSGSGGGGGDFTATSLKASGSWQAGGSSAGFNWSYPIPVPPVPGGLAPKIALNYNSQSQDGLTSSTNNQPSWIGDGWDYSPGFVERSYQSCHENPTGTTKTWDSCWSSENTLTLSLGGSSSTLIKDDATGTYHPQSDANERVEYLTGADNGAHNGEYWRITAPDGTQYYFGQHKLPGWTSTTNPVTNSVWTSPVFATASGQPCYNATWANSWCQQAYRWNLDYVVDPHKNAIAYFYTTEQNYYSRNLGSIANTPYVREGYLTRIQYGQRADQVYSTQPAAQVTFAVNGRCKTSATGCDPTTLTKTTAPSWPDVPQDLDCANGAACQAQSPSFWSKYMLTGIQTQALVGTTETNVDSWALRHSFPDTLDTTTASLWLDSVTHTGQDTTAGGSTVAIALPPITFTGTPLSNRVNVTNGYPPITRHRLTKITTETGELINVNYSSAVCPTCTPADASQNTSLAYPVYWTPTGQTSPILDWFNKYIVTHVTEQDPTGGSANDDIVTTYTPVGSPAWHYNDNPLTPSKRRTWDQWRGYGGMSVSTGTAPDPITKTTYTYFRGMDGDTLPNNATRSVTVADSRGDPAVADADQYAGVTYETRVFNGAALVTDTITDPWSSAATATHALTGLPAQRAYHRDSASVRVYTPLASGAVRETRTDRSHDAYGRVTKVDDQGDVGSTGDDLCTATSFTDNTGTAWILNAVAEVKSVSVRCASTPALPADLISDSLTFYDASTVLGAPPTAGDKTMSQKVSSYNGAQPVYLTTQTATYDQYGRPRTTTDALNHTTSTSYTPASGANPTSVTTTDPMTLTATNVYDPLRGLPKSETDPAGYVTSGQYDALGRLTAVYRPGQAAPNPANIKYTYAISNTAPSAVNTYTLNDDGSYRRSEALYDAMLRLRETQVETVDSGRTITDTIYNTAGWKSESTDPYYNSSPVDATYVQAPVGQVASATGYSYDGVGRVRQQTAYANGTETWHTTFTYGGNFTTTVPPAGATATTSVIDARGRTTDLIQYHAEANTDYVHAAATDYSRTQYTYYPDGKRATLVDPANNRWSWQYNLLGYQTDARDPDTGHTVSAYDDAGRLTSITDGRNKQTTFTYDNDNRKTAAYDTTSTQTLSAANQNQGWTYDTVKKGMPATSTSWSNGDVYTSSVLAYNTIGKPAATKVTLAGEGTTLVPAAGFTTSYGYTLTGLLKTVSDPAAGGLPAETVTYGYDKFGEPTSVVGSGGASWTYVSAVGYDELGQPLQYSFGPTTNWVRDTMTYDPQTRKMTNFQVTDATASGDVENVTYAYGNSTVSRGAGLLTKTVDTQDAGTATDTQCFTYDYATRIDQAWTATDGCAATPTPGSSSTVGGSTSPYWQSWSYDAAGNRQTQVEHDPAGTTANDTTTTYHYPASGSTAIQPHTLTSTTATGPRAAEHTLTLGYDTGGNTTTVTGGVSGNQTMAWSDQNKLLSVATAAGTASYVYDVDGHMVVRRDPSRTTAYLGDTQLVLNRTSGTVSGTRFYAVGGVTIASRSSSGVSYLIPDRQGTGQLAVNASTLAVTRRQFLPFGQTRSAPPTGWAGDLGFVGGSTDADTGLIDLGVREYDPEIGRFLSSDPLLESTDPSQTNGYGYAGNDPVSQSDPGGMKACSDDACAPGADYEDLNGNYVSVAGDNDGCGGCSHDHQGGGGHKASGGSSPLYVPITNHVLVRANDPHYAAMSRAFAKTWGGATPKTARQEMNMWYMVCIGGGNPDLCPMGFKNYLYQMVEIPMTDPTGGRPITESGVFLLGPEFNSSGGATEAKVTFYRGTTWGDASEVEANQAIDTARVAANQAATPPASGPGVYLTSQRSTAEYYANLAGGNGRGMGPGLVRIDVSAQWFSEFSARNGIEYEAPVPQPPTPGQTETIIRMENMDEFNANAAFTSEEPRQMGGFVRGAGGE
jgi:RHS repeat-associated protein